MPEPMTFKTIMPEMIMTEKINLPEKESQFKSYHYIQVLQELGFDFQLRILDDKIFVNGKPISDIVENTILSKANDYGLMRVNVLKRHIVAYAVTKSFHPIQDYLNSLTWDGQEHISYLASFFEDEDNLFPIVFSRWIIGAVAKAYNPVRNRMLVLDGAQKIGKSYFVHWLADPVNEYFTEGAIEPNNKDHRIRRINKFIWEVSELGNTTRRADIEALKDFLTNLEVIERLPYGHTDIQKPTLCSYIGTVNNIGGIFSDPTGHSRFMSVNLKSINREYSQMVDVNQVWAEAVARYKMGETWEPTKEELFKIDSVNESYAIEEPLTEMIQKYFQIDANRENWFTPTTRIIERLRTSDGWKLSNTKMESMAISSALKTFGLKRPKTSPRGYFGMLEKSIN